MKKLGKLTINPEKVIKNEELVNLRGGYDGYTESGTCCGWGGGDNAVHCHVSKDTAIFWAGCTDTAYGTGCGGGYWCCDNCDTASWVN